MGIYDYENGYAVFEIQRDNENYTRGLLIKTEMLCMAQLK